MPYFSKEAVFVREVQEESYKVSRAPTGKKVKNKMETEGTKNSVPDLPKTNINTRGNVQTLQP